MSLIVSYSGLRGIVGESLTPAVAFRFARAFGRMVTQRFPQPVIAIGRDTRASGPDLAAAVARGLAPFAKLVDLGVVATPTVQLSLAMLPAHAAICVTASHNPAQWNGMKFFIGPLNTVLDAPETKALLAAADAETDVDDEVPATLDDRHAIAIEAHLTRVLAQVDVARIKKRAFRVALDAGQGAGAEAAERLLEALGCQFVSVQAARESEPVPEQLGALIAEVQRGRRDVGFAQDLDADRLALVTETGTPPGEDATLVLAVSHLLARGGKATVVTNSQTTRAVADVTAQFGAELVEVPVGEVNLSRALAEALARGVRAFGGEGNGGVIYPPVSLGRDSLIGIALILEALASGPATLSQRLRALPRYESRKLKLKKTDLQPLYERVVSAFPEASVSRLDGLKLVFSDGAWLSLRPSNTEPIVRLVAESRSTVWLDAVIEKVTRL